MLERLSKLAVARWRIVLALTALFCMLGWKCFDALPIEAFPDVQDVQVQVVHPNEVKWITESRGKTDRVDAKKLAELARAPKLPPWRKRMYAANSANKRARPETYRDEWAEGDTTMC